MQGLLGALLTATASSASRPVSMSFINSALAPRDALLPFLHHGRAVAVPAAAGGADVAAEVLGQVLVLPVRWLIGLACRLGKLVPDSLPVWWGVRARLDRCS
jgi:hypothetical protein